MNTVQETVDLLVIGAGQAGLALSYHLRQTRLRFQLVERHARVGESWRRRYDSLVLFTPRAYSALPGLPVPGDPWEYPTKDEIADYLEHYATHFALPVALGHGIGRLTQAEGGFRATTDDGSHVVARAVVIASGAFQRPAVPPLAARLAADVQQWTPQTYRNPGQLQKGPVLVVGDGATGRQIALELVAGRSVYLATGRPRRPMPERVLGRDLFWWLDQLGILHAPRESAIGRYLRESDNFPGNSLSLDNLRRQGVMVAGRLVEADGQRVRFADGLTASVAAVVWATGYWDESEWVAIPAAKDGAGRFVESAGVSPVRGLYFIGRSWQRNRGSALLTGVGEDARLLVPEIVRYLAGRPRAAGPFSTPATAEPVSLAG